MSLNEKQITWITAGILGFLVLAGAGAVWYFDFNLFSEKRDQIRKLEADREVALDKQKKVPGLKAELEKFFAETAVKAEKIPSLDSAQFDAFIDTVERSSRRSGASVWTAKTVLPKGTSRTAPGAKKLPETLYKLDYELTCVGAFYPLLRFVNLLETERRYIEIKEITFGTAKTSSLEADKVPPRQLKVKVTTYAFRKVDDQKAEAKPEKIEDSTLPADAVKVKKAAPAEKKPVKGKEEPAKKDDAKSPEKK